MEVTVIPSAVGITCTHVNTRVAIPPIPNNTPKILLKLNSLLIVISFLY